MRVIAREKRSRVGGTACVCVRNMTLTRILGVEVHALLKNRTLNVNVILQSWDTVYITYMWRESIV